jgi:predicted O-methyltransferase YrrM
MEEYLLLESLADEYQGKRALEIGSYHGRSTVLLAQFFSSVMAIDLWGDTEDGTAQHESIGQLHFASFIQNITRLGLIDKVVPCVGTSSILNHMPDLDFDFIYVDGSHHYEDVKKDLWMVSDHLVPNGVIVVHDYKRPGWGYPPFNHSDTDPWLGVAMAVKDFVKESGFELISHKLGTALIKRGGK